MNLHNKKILVGISGGIAAYKTATLVRQLRQQGAEIKVVMTESAKQFISPLTLQALSGDKVRDALFDLDAEQGMSHIELARWAEIIVIAPATANCIARLAVGMADDLLTTICLATKAKILLAPAMNQQMWHNQFTQKNIAVLQENGMGILGPDSGDQACGEFGYGRMLEPEAIIAATESYLQPKLLRDKTVLITAGPTREALDPVRFLSNHSSGKMGYALAEAARDLGAKVILISGPTVLAIPYGVQCEKVVTALEMRAQVFANLSDVDIFIACAAVADYRPKITRANKIKKSAEEIKIELIPNPDILAEVACSANRPECVVGFAAETENLLKNAELKLQQKNLDLIIANQVGEGQGFDVDINAVSLLFRTGEIRQLEMTVKSNLARQIFSELVQHTLVFNL